MLNAAQYRAAIIFPSEKICLDEDIVLVRRGQRTFWHTNSEVLWRK
jgi:hypothetical protein